MTMQTPGQQVGFAQQMAKLQSNMPSILARLQDPQQLQQSAQMLAQMMPPPDLGAVRASITTPVGSGSPGPENSVGLPQGNRPAPQGLNPAAAADPFNFSGPASQAYANAQRAMTATAFAPAAPNIPTPGTNLPGPNRLPEGTPVPMGPPLRVTGQFGPFDGLVNAYLRQAGF